MRINDRGLQLVKHFEGVRLTAYADPVGILTVGYGHTGPDVRRGMTITMAKADGLLRSDLGVAEAAVGALARVPLTPDQASALVSFAFNLGRGNLAASTLLRKLNAGDPAGAADEFARWVHGTIRGAKVVLPGLVRRRREERNLFLGRDLDLGGRIVRAATPRPPLPAEAVDRAVPQDTGRCSSPGP
jgi:lysozyme